MKRALAIVILLAAFIALGAHYFGNVSKHWAAAAGLPSDISGLQIWLKPESLSGADGDAIATWTDSSGNGYNATNAAAAGQPKLTNNVLGTYEGAYFNGTSDRLGFTGGALSILKNVEAATFILVIKAGLNATDAQYESPCGFSINGSLSSARFLVGHNSQVTNWVCRGRRLDADAGFDSDLFIVPKLKFFALIAIPQWSTTEVQIYTNNVQAMSDTTWGGTDGNTADTASNVASIGEYAQAAGYYGCALVEYIVYNKKLSAGELSTINTYLTTKYGAYSTW